MKMRYALLGFGFAILCYFAYVLVPTPMGQHPSTLVWIGRWTLGHMAQDFGYGYTAQGAWSLFQALFAAWAVWAFIIVVPPIMRAMLPSRQEWRAIVAHRFVPAGGFTLTKLILTLSLTAVVIAMIGTAHNFYLGIFYGGSDASTFPWLLALIAALVMSVIAVNLDWVARRYHVS